MFAAVTFPPSQSPLAYLAKVSPARASPALRTTRDIWPATSVTCVLDTTHHPPPTLPVLWALGCQYHNFSSIQSRNLVSIY